MTGLVSEHVSEIMLGIGWLVENQATWEFDKTRIKLGGAYHNLRRPSQANLCCRTQTHIHIHKPTRRQTYRQTEIHTHTEHATCYLRFAKNVLGSVVYV